MKILKEFNETIGIYPNSLSKNMCDEIIEAFKKAEINNKVNDGITFRGVDHSIKKTRDVNLDSLGNQYFYLVNELENVARKNMFNHINKWTR